MHRNPRKLELGRIMHRRFSKLFGLSIFAGLFLTAPIYAAGYWNVPSTFCQCIGYGCGAGYHAPLVLGPVSHAGWLDHNEIRLPYAPRPAYAPGCYNCRNTFESSSVLESMNLLPAGRRFAPTPAAHRSPLRR
jgi:hypothetical protein